jgi:hypothetical protein
MAGAAESRAGSDAQRAKDQSRNIDSEISNRGVMANIAGKNANTAARNATTAEGNLTETQGYHKDLKEFRTKELEKVSPSQQSMAMDLVLRTLGQDPEMRPYVTKTDKGFWEVNDFVDKNSPSYRVFQDRVKRALKSTVKNMTPYDQEGDHGLELIPPGGRR